MLCDFCHKREAVFFIEQMSQNTRRKINICMECAAEHGLTPDPKDIQRSIGTLFDEIAKTDQAENSEAQKLCPVCGRSLAQIRKTGQTGCPECYEIFRSEIVLEMKNRSIAGPYTGTLPRRIASFRSVLTDRIDLENKLRESLKNEDYEKAAVYRDYLKALEKHPVADGSSENGADNG